jgi:hypothetical protein
MPRAEVLGSVRLRGATLGKEGDEPLNLYGTHIAGDLLGQKVSSEGEVHLLDTKVDGLLNISGCRLRNQGAVAFDGSRLQVGGPILCRQQVRVEGAFYLRRARVGGFVDFAGASIANTQGPTLFAPAAEIDGGLTVSNSEFDGWISLWRARIASTVDLSGAVIRTTGADRDTSDKAALVCEHLAADRLTLPSSIRGATDVIDLTNARVTVVDAPSSQSALRFKLDGFSYETLRPFLPADLRLEWLHRSNESGYCPQPYEQLASAYRRIGHDVDARRVLLEKNRRRRAEQRVLARAWGVLQDATTGYGYRPARAGAWLLALLAVGTTLFTLYPPLALKEAPPFSSFFYTLDLLLPILSYGQEAAYRPTGVGQVVAYLFVTAGWILATTLLTGITRVLTRS